MSRGLPRSRAPRGSSAGARGPLILAVAVLTVGLLAGCQAATPSDAAGSTAAPASTSTPTTTGTPLPDPHSLTGASTAASISDVVPIATDVTSVLPVTVTDEEGTKVTITDTSRILALDLYGTLAETVVGLGLADKLVGRTVSNTMASMADLPLVTQDGHELNGEAILKLKPTVILTDKSIGPREVQDQLRDAGVAVVFFDGSRSLATVGEQILAVGHALGVDTAAQQLADRSEQEITDAKADIAAMAPSDPAKKLRIAFLYVRGAGSIFFILGKGEGADDLIDSLGAIDVATEAGITGARPANSEALLAINPDLILTMTGGVESTGGLKGLLARPGVSDTTAGNNHRVVDMSDGQILSFGPTTGAVLRSLAQAIYAPTELRP
ncbi:hemin ABC transporter substrate-binding protein [Glaciihabitans sp. dw_435]|uniref:heme/hemin ABC transporter substrate-binding protein n=1 Tax=Glaciihabitans sp. dw_435 TaxID=2720081 RepID=UPI001BD4DF4B|nr:ABC transporter substrate-binding protein [Glaciihabitans sp. dw_435]